MQKAWRLQIISLIHSSLLSSSPVNPFPRTIKQQSNRQDLALHSSDSQHLPSGIALPAGKMGSRGWLKGTQSTDYCQPGRSVLVGLGVDSAPRCELLVHAEKVPCSGQVTEASLAKVVCVRGPTYLLGSSVVTAPEKRKAGKLARSIKGEHLYLYRSWIFHFLTELLAMGRTLYFISTVNDQVEVIFGRVFQSWACTHLHGALT